jgi:excinuclease ABC subunit C
VALAVLAELGLQDISAVGLAKDKGPSPRKIVEKTADKVYLPNVKDPVLLGRSASLRYLQRIRDEAHRFAIRYHKKLRGKHGLQTLLDDIPGIGEVKKKALLKEFGSPQGIQEASADKLSQVEPMTRKDAHTVFEFFHPPQG